MAPRTDCWRSARSRWTGASSFRDLKIIQGTRGPFVAMPSRKLMDRCRRCGCKNAPFVVLQSVRHQAPEDPAPKEQDGRAKLYADIAPHQQRMP
ncbi:MAG: hypothetical protein R3B90_21000 [Planctomycetaceae bacterium]